MKRKVCLLGVLIVMLSLLPSAGGLAAPQTSDGGPDSRNLGARSAIAASPNHSGSSPYIPPTSTDEVFVADQGWHLDQYLFRNNVPGGKLVFYINLDRYYSDQMHFDSNGYLDNAADLINKHILPETATLKLVVYDVDHDSSYDGNSDGVPDPEVDHVYVNDHLVVDASGQAIKLTSGNNTWSTWTTNIPIEWLRFPQQKGSDTSKPAPVANKIAIDIDTTTPGYWAVECDWGSLEIKTPVRPVLLVHGFQPDGTSEPEQYWADWLGWLNDAMTPAKTVRLGGWSSYEDNAQIMAGVVPGFKSEYGVDKIYIVGHSKGGLDSRAYLANHNDVAKLAQIGSPNGGAFLANLAKTAKIGAWAFDPIVAAFLSFIGEPAATQLTTPYMKIWNLFHPKNSVTSYISWAGDHSPGGWCAGAWYIPGHDDMVVAVDEAFALSYAAHERRPTDDESSVHGGLVHSSDVFSDVTNWLQAVGASAAGITSTSALPGALPAVVQQQQTATIAGQVSQGETNVHILTEGPGDLLSLTLLWGEGDLDVVVVMPNGTVVDPAVAAAASDIEFQVQDEIVGLKTKTYTFQGPMPGNWTINVTGVDIEDHEGYVIMGFVTGSPVALSASSDATYYRPGDVITITGTPTENGLPVLGSTVTAAVQAPDESIEALTLYDDGLHSDELAGDGIFGNTFSPSLSGFYSIVVDAIVPLASGGEVTRSAFVQVSVSASTTALNGSYADRGVDLNANGLYDQLVIDVGLNVSNAGDYLLSGNLEDSAGTVIERVSQRLTLAAGSQVFSLIFDGSLIGQNQVDGPYYLRDVALADADAIGPLLLDYTSEAYITAAYSYQQFERATIWLTDDNHDNGVDTDGNGLFNYLAVALTFEVVSPGTYSANARLVDDDGAEIVWASTSGYINGQGVLELHFDGEAIGKHGVNGPYLVNDLSIFQTSGGGASATIGHAHTTAFYDFQQFEGAQIADLTLTKTGAPHPAVKQGMPLVYTFAVENLDLGDAQNVTIHDTLPAGVTPGGVADIPVGTVASGAVASAALEVTVNTDTVGLIVNQATVSTSTPETNYDNNSASLTTMVTADRACTGQVPYWKYQLDPASAAPAFDAATLGAFLDITNYASTVFSEQAPASTLQEAYNLLSIQRPTVRQEARQRLLAAWLNFAQGGVGWDELINTDKDFVPDTPFHQLVANIEAILTNPNATIAQLREASRLAQAINLAHFTKPCLAP